MAPSAPMRTPAIALRKAPKRSGRSASIVSDGIDLTDHLLHRRVFDGDVLDSTPIPRGGDHSLGRRVTPGRSISTVRDGACSVTSLWARNWRRSWSVG